MIERVLSIVQQKNRASDVRQFPKLPAYLTIFSISFNSRWQLLQIFFDNVSNFCSFIVTSKVELLFSTLDDHVFENDERGWTDYDYLKLTFKIIKITLKITFNQRRERK